MATGLPESTKERQCARQAGGCLTGRDPDIEFGEGAGAPRGRRDVASSSKYCCCTSNRGSLPAAAAMTAAAGARLLLGCGCAFAAAATMSPLQAPQKDMLSDTQSFYLIRPICIPTATEFVSKCRFGHS